MDNFVSKLSQKINGQDAIKANLMADAAEKDRMQKQLEEYESMIRSVHSLCRKQEANNETMRSLLGELGQAIPEAVQAQTAATDAEAASELLNELKDCLSRSDEFTHKECVKVYRNVQALLEEQDKKRLAEDEFVRAALSGLEEQAKEQKGQLLQLHGQAENLKAQIINSRPKDLTGELAELKQLLKKQNRSNKALLWLLMLIGAMNIAVVLLIHFGLLGVF